MKLRPPAWLPRPESHMAGLWRKRSGVDFAKAKSVFWGWKSAVAETWNLLEDGRLPHEGSQSSVLQSILEPAHREGKAETEGASSPNVDSIRTAWAALGWSTKRQCDEWPHLMVAALRTYPGRAHLIFQATFDVDVVPSYMAEDTINFLLHMRESPKVREKAIIPFDTPAAEDLLSVLRYVLEKSPPDYLRLRQSSLYLFTRMLASSLDNVADLYHDLVRYQHPMHKNTRLQIAGRLAGSPRPEHKTLAVNVLQRALAETDLDINTPQGAALCTAILTAGEGDSVEAAETGSSHSTPAATPAELFELLLQCGLEPNLITYTTIIRGLCLKQELDAALQVLQLMLSEAKTEPDAFVYSILMNGAKIGCNYPIIQQVAQSAAAHGVRHPFLWNDFLQAIYTTALNEARRDRQLKRPRVIPAFPLMVQAYARVFELAPLRKLLPDVNLDFVAAADFASSSSGASRNGPSSRLGAGTNIPSNRHWEFAAQLAPTVRSLPKLSPVELVEPTGSTLATMVLGYIQGLSNPYDVITFYTHFRRLLQTGDPMATRLVRDQSSQVHDCVVMALTEFEGMLRAALDVVSDMLRDAAAALEADKEGGSAAAATSVHGGHHPPPSVYTWSILINGFMFHRQYKQGERVLNMMRERGVEPNLVTWNTLLAGYARAQRSGNTISTFERLERTGKEPDDFTYRGLSYLNDQTSVVKLLELRQARAVNAAADAAGTAVDAAVPVSSEAINKAPSPVLLSRPEQSAVSSVGRGADNGAGRPRNPGAATNHRGLTNDVDELQGLQGEVAEIAKMMDEEQRDDAAAESGEEKRG
ncbi:hypothetical protein HMPREF1624_00108 [Sporothrix schenckii ATCC 58251]|uniref:Pentacotripeptide-repeat region of PRORP domain-containing protein n=1 Tax=Sporothrix schenckii (strain ATCC 58251 / de Perez 2211183) TaxID=1391915 RepID=U7Q1M5_SPOS1|nr:hypothetical protein HMPREF1624_00108 [Sporothrix schenckii ATCC 58251]